MDTSYFYDDSDVQMFPAKPKLPEKQKGVISISLNFVFYLLIYFLVFNGNLKLLAAVLMAMFIHEFGHFVMMKRYGHNDRRLFFIPFLNMFLGSEERAVSLKQKLYILFAGPLPGVILGMALLFAGGQKHNEQMNLLGWIFLTWNVVNLVPLEVMDGGHISNTLFPRSNFIIHLVVTILVSLFIVGFVIIQKNFLALMIPLFLGFRLQAMAKMGKLRMKLEGKGLDLRLNYEELNNKQYWLIRKELLLLSSVPAMNASADEMSESIYEGLIMQNIKAVLLNQPYDDLSVRGKILFTAFWILSLVIPVVFVVLLTKNLF